jgi:L-asparaginase
MEADMDLWKARILLLPNNTKDSKQLQQYSEVTHGALLGQKSPFLINKKGGSTMWRRRKIRSFYFCIIMMICLPLATYAAEQLPLIKIIATGGTIACSYDAEKGGWVPALKGEDLVKAVPELKEIARLEVEEMPPDISWSDATVEHWIEVSKRLNEVCADPKVAGVVITEGTDAMDEGPYFMDLTLTSEKPVVCVGSLRGGTHKWSDGPFNLYNAVRVAACPEAWGKGVMLVMNGKIFAARDVIKTHTHAIETFQSPEFGPIGVADLDEVRFYREPLRRLTIPLDPEVKTLPRVEIVFHYAGRDGRVIRYLLNRGDLDGLVVAACGIGNAGRVLGKAIEEVRAKGIPVVLSTRVSAGRIIPIYASPGRGIPLKKAGVVMGANLGPWRARILLMLAMTKTKDPKELQKYLDAL